MTDTTHTSEPGRANGANARTASPAPTATDPTEVVADPTQPAGDGEEQDGCVVGKLVKVDHPPLPASQRADRRAWRRTLRMLALVAYVPLLLTRPGWVSADTKTYLYLDPGQLLDRARSMWDPTVGMGTVSHQRIGFLWPMGPWYWLAETAGLPDWVAQRLWWGSIMLAAGAGVAYLLRTLGWRPGPGATAAVFGYALSPVILTLVARLSGVLLPFCGLTWLVAFAVQTNRHRGWRYPALFALAAVTFGSVNATGILLVGIAPALWLAYSAVGSREASVKQAAISAARIAVLTLATSAWWIAGLNVQRTNGLEITRYSETATTVASTSLSHEVLRGLGYWFFYGRDRLGPWIEPSRGYTQWAPLIAVTYLIPLLGIAGAAIARWRHRSYFVLLVLVGTALAVGAYPWDANPPFPHLIQAFQSTDAGLAMRSLPRAVPLVALGMAVLLGSGIASLVSRWPRVKRPATLGAVVLAVLALPPLWLGQFVPDNLRRREEVPDHWQDAAAYLDAHDDGTRVLVVPGSDFAAYDWGATVDPVLPGLMDRPSVQREAVPNGSPASAHLLDAFDLTLQEGTADADALAPMARLMRAGDVVVVGDWEYERNSVPEPHRMWDLARHAPGFTDPVGFGESDADVPAVGVLPLPEDERMPIVATHGTAGGVLVAGDGAGLVDAAGAGLIDGRELIRYSATLDDREVQAALDDGAVLLLTDSNRKRGERWNTLRHNRGYTETATGGPLTTDLNDNRLPVFADTAADTDTAAMTVVERRGGISAEASSYGNAITYVPEERPMMAVDGDPDTSWRTGAFADVQGERLELTVDEPVTTDRITFHQAGGEATRTVSKVRLRFPSGDPVDATLDDSSSDEAGQVVSFPERTFDRVSIEILADSAGHLPRYTGQSGVGFSEVEIGGEANAPAVDGRGEVVRLPTDLLDAAGPASADRPLAVSLTRQRQDPTDAARADEEPALVRSIELPSARRFELDGTARLSARAAAEVTGDLIGRPHDDETTWATSSDSPTGAIEPSAPLIIDGDPTTAWHTDGDLLEGQWVEVSLPEPVTITDLPLGIVDDGRHSRPTQLTLSVDGEEVATVDVPRAAADDRGSDGTVDLDIPEVTGSRFRLELNEVAVLELPGAVFGDPTPPVAFTEIGLPGPKVPELDERFDSGCRSDLLAVDGEPVPLRIRGTMADALASRPLSVTPCGGGRIALARGESLITTARGDQVGIDLDQLVLRSRVADEGGLLATTDDRQAGPQVEIADDGATHLRVHVDGAEPGQPFWLVLGQSYNDGWAATPAGGNAQRPELVDGFANGWLITPDAASFDVALEFTPQRSVDLALWLSLLAGLGCVVLALRPARPLATERVPAGHQAPDLEPAPFSPGPALRFPGLRPTLPAAALTTAAMTALAWLLAGPALAAVVGLATAVGSRVRPARGAILAASAAALALAAVYVLYIQLLHHPGPGLDWPYEMRRAHPLGWLAVLLLATDVALTRLWHRTKPYL